MDLKPQIDQLGIKTIAVGTGSKFFAEKFQKGLPFEGDIFLDPEANSFKAMSLPRLSTWETIKRFFLSPSSIFFYQKISSEYPASDMEGDGKQTGGVFVMAQGKENVSLYSFQESEHSTDQFADNEKILQACKLAMEESRKI